MQWLNALALATILVAAAEPVSALKFSKKDVGKVPTGWTVAKTGAGEGSVWSVVIDETAPASTGVVLAQTAEQQKITDRDDVKHRIQFERNKVLMEQIPHKVALSSDAHVR